MRGDRCATAGARSCGPSTTAATGSSATTSWWRRRSATGSGSRRSGPTRTDPRSPSPTAASRRASPRRATRRDWYGYRRALAQILSPQASERLRDAGPLLDRALPRPGRGARRVRVRPRPHLPGPRVGHAGVARLPAGGVAVVLRHLPRRLRVPGRLARAPTRPRRRTDRCWRRIDEELRDRIASPRDDALTAIAHHEVDGERLPEDIAQSIAFLTTVGRHRHDDVAHRRRAAAPVAVPGRPRATDRRARPAPARHRGVPPLLPAGARAQAHRRGRHRVRRRRDEAGRRACS